MTRFVSRVACMPLSGTVPGSTGRGGSADLIGPLHMPQNKLRRLPRLAGGRVYRQRVRVWHPEHLDFLAPPGDVGQVNVLQPRPTIRRVLAPADDRGLAREPHGEEPGPPLPRQPFYPAEPDLVEGLSGV